MVRLEDRAALLTSEEAWPLSSHDEWALASMQCGSTGYAKHPN
jgi:hypothetical protein